MRFKVTINTIVFLSFNFLLMMSLKSQNLSNTSESCDSVINKDSWKNTSYDKSIFANFDSHGNLKTFGYLNKKKKIRIFIRIKNDKFGLLICKNNAR